MKLTDDEKAIVWRVLKPPPSRLGVLFDYGVYIVPTSLFAIYGLVNHAWIALLVAYASLLLVFVLYLSWSHRSGAHLRSALAKYEARTSLLSGEPSHGEG